VGPRGVWVLLVAEVPFLGFLIGLKFLICLFGLPRFFCVFTVSSLCGCFFAVFEIFLVILCNGVVFFSLHAPCRLMFDFWVFYAQFGACCFFKPGFAHSPEDCDTSRRSDEPVLLFPPNSLVFGPPAFLPCFLFFGTGVPIHRVSLLLQLFPRDLVSLPPIFNPSLHHLLLLQSFFSPLAGSSTTTVRRGLHLS